MDLEEPERALEIIRGPPAIQIGWNPFPIKSHRECMALDRHLRLDGDKFNQVVTLYSLLIIWVSFSNTLFSSPAANL